MKLLLSMAFIISSFVIMPDADAKTRYGSVLCKQSGFDCHTVKRGETWSKLFPNAEKRHLVKKVNRMNTNIYPGMVIAIPKRYHSKDHMDYSPFPKQIAASEFNKVIVNQKIFAWAAYSESGKLLNWGPMSGGKSWCADVGRGCGTVTGTYTVQRKQGAGCRSGKYPLPNGGAPMPYCMHFYRGFAMHGSATVPGYHDSHGCVRMFTSDAKWLNQNFVRVGYTKVIVKPK